MRPVLFGDVTAIARSLLKMKDKDRATAVHQALTQASAADAYRIRTGKLHQRWGNGSLSSAVERYPKASEPFLDDIDYCSCMALVFTSLVNWRQEKAAFNQRHN